MKRLILSSLLSCMLIGQVSCDADPIPQNNTIANIVAFSGLVGSFLAPMFIAHGTNIPKWILNWAKKEPQITTIKREADAKVAAWWLSVASITAASATTLCTSTNEILTGMAVSSLMGSVFSLYFTHGV